MAFLENIILKCTLICNLNFVYSPVNLCKDIFLNSHWNDRLFSTLWLLVSFALYISPINFSQNEWWQYFTLRSPLVRTGRMFGFRSIFGWGSHEFTGNKLMCRSNCPNCNMCNVSGDLVISFMEWPLFF